MDVTLSIIAGLGLRIFLLNTVARTSGTLSTAALGMWEGAVLHQVSGRSSSPNFDHLLAYGLRLTVDLLIWKDVQRLYLIVLWSTLGTVTSEAIIPYASLRSALKKQRDHELRDRRNRHARSISATGSTPSTSFPPRLRAYKPPETQPTSTLPENPPLNTSTPIFLSDRPPTPPSFFLEETFISPSPKPIILQTPQSFDTISPPPEDALPVRPRSGVASTFNHSSDTDSPLPVPMHLPTPPDSAQSANPPDALNDSQKIEIHDNQILGFAPDLAPIPEICSPEGNGSPIHNIESDPNYVNLNTGLQRISRWLQSQPADLEPFFSKPFSPTTSPDRPVLVPARVQHQDLLWQTDLLPEEQQQTNTHEETKLQANKANDIGNESIIDTDSDELRTPGPRDELNAATDNEHDDDPLQTPRQLLQTEDQLTPPHSIEDEGEGEELSPLGINVRSALPDSAVAYDMLNQFQPLSSEQNAQEAPLHAMEENEILQIPGSLSQNLLLQPPLPASSPLFRPSPLARESSSPPSPSTILSDPSDASALSTRVPGRLYSRADELRHQAREEEKLRAQLEDERKLAERQGRTMDALNLKIKIRDMDLETYRLHEKAARRYYTALNPLGQSHKIDVHGLRPREAFDRIERAIVRANEEKRTTVVVIVGKGLHSVNQQPTLKPVVMREMQRLKIKCEINPRNAGQLIITLPKHVNSSS